MKTVLSLLFAAVTHISATKDYQLILSQKDVGAATFNGNVKYTYLENEHNPTADTFTNIGDLNPSDFIDDDGYYQFKLIYTNLHNYNADKSVNNDLSVTLEWKQTSWLTATTITGYTAINVPTQTNTRWLPNSDFEGLGLSSSISSFLDGDAQSHSYWFNSVGTIYIWYGGIPSFNEQVAMTAALYVYGEEIQPTLECPSGTEQIGDLNADIGGCGLEGCNARYQDNYANINECKAGCDDDARCVSFSWAPLNGDRNHPGKTACTLYNSATPNQVWGPSQILCGTAGSYQLILSQSDVREATFSSNVRTTYLENENDPTADTFTNIGDLTPSDFVDEDGYYHFKLIYTNLHSYNADKSVDNELSVTVEWTQTSWLTATAIMGYFPINVPKQTNTHWLPNSDFEGLGLSSSGNSFLDGDAQSHSYWFNSVGTLNSWYGGIPSFNEQVAMTAALYIYEPLVCPDGTEQIGGLNADIGGCGLEGCNARYQDNYADIDECKVGCDDNAQCVSFSWAPLNGDKNHPGKTVCTLYNSDVQNQLWGPEQIICSPVDPESNVIYPAPTDNPTQSPTDEPTISPTDEPTKSPTDEPTQTPTDEPTRSPTDEPTKSPTNDPTRDPTEDPTQTPTDEPTRSPTDEPTRSPTDEPTKSPTDEPTKSPTDEPTKSPTDEPTQSPTLTPLVCPAGTYQIGGLNADIEGCGLQGCNARYQNNYPNVDACKAGCDRYSGCASFSWAPLNGDRNHPGVSVCTLYPSAVSNRQFGPQQILCGLVGRADIIIYPNEVNKPADGVYYIEISKPVFLAMLGLIAAVIVVNIMMIYCIKRKNKNRNKGYGVVKHVDSDSEYA